MSDCSSRAKLEIVVGHFQFILDHRESIAKSARQQSNVCSLLDDVPRIQSKSFGLIKCLISLIQAEKVAEGHSLASQQIWRRFADLCGDLESIESDCVSPRFKGREAQHLPRRR